MIFVHFMKDVVSFSSFTVEAHGPFIRSRTRSFERKNTMATIGRWTEAGVMDEEYLFRDNADFMKQIGLGH